MHINSNSKKKIALNKYLQLYITCFNQRSFNNFLDILMDKNQTTSLILNHSFGHNLCSRSSNKECYLTLDIPLFKSLIWTRFRALNLIPNIRNTMGFQFPSLNPHGNVMTHFLSFFHNFMSVLES
jgi:hypothetical protein